MLFIIIFFCGTIRGMGTCWANETPFILVISNPHLSSMYAPFFVARELGYWDSEGVDVVKEIHLVPFIDKARYRVCITIQM